MSAKQSIAIVLLLVGSMIGLINIVCAALFGAVWLTRGGFNWTSFQSNPVMFLWTLVLSVIAFVGMGALAAFALYCAKNERTLFDRSRPRSPYEDRSHNSRLTDV